MARERKKEKKKVNEGERKRQRNILMKKGSKCDIN